MSDEGNLDLNNELRGHVEVRSHKKRYALIMIVFVILVVIGIGLFQWHQMRFAESCIQGYWMISDDTFLLIDDCIVRVAKISNGVVNIFQDTDSTISYDFVKTILSSDVHKFNIVRSNKCGSKGTHELNKLFQSKKLILEVTPALGLCTIKDSKSDSSIICYKDPVMTLDYFKK